MKFRTLRADEIEVRTQQIKENGVSVLLYKTARTDANLLDETVGADNWQNDFKSIDGKMFGYISIKCGNEWVTKSDSGTEGNIEAEKSLASDAFKRAGFKWGIGRELYTAPFIWISADVIKIENRGGKFYTNEKFEVSKIGYNENNEINMLEIINSKKQTVYTFGSKTPVKTAPISDQKPTKRTLSVAAQKEIDAATTIDSLIHIYNMYATVEPITELREACALKRELLQGLGMK